MPHLDPDTLALLALGETVTTDADNDHLAECADCRDELVALAAAVKVGRHSLTDDALRTPDPRVWRSVSDELRLAPHRSRRLVPVVAAAASVTLVVGAAVAWQALRPTQATVLAKASLTAFPAWPSAEGRAVLEEQPDGSRTVTVTLNAAPAEGAFREAWLITSDATDLVSLGVVRGSSSTFDVPSGVDVARFDLVDVSQEIDDGDPAHSGDSIVRGRLRGLSTRG